MTTMIWILRDFKPILNLDLYGEHTPKEIITGSKIDLDLSAGLTYTRVYTVIKPGKEQSLHLLVHELINNSADW